MRMAGCGFLQGYYLGRPMDLAATSALLAEQAAGPTPPAQRQATG